MSDRVPFFGAATATQIKELARRGFATVLTVADPPRELSIMRLDPEHSRYVTVIVDEFQVKDSNTQARTGSDDGAEVTALNGTIRRFEPADPDAAHLLPGDRFETEIGPCIVTVVHPVKYGVERAEYVLEEGSA